MAPQHASLERLMKLVSGVAGWGAEHHVVVSYAEVSRFVSHDETERTGKWVWLASIETCGDKQKVSAQGATLAAALYALALAVCQYFADSSRWSKDNNTRAAQLVALFASEEQ